ncbi:MAG: DUF58 domain-containing protein [Actinomycetota bacterium]
MPPPPPDPAGAPPSASARRRHLDLGASTAGAAGVAVLGLSLSTLGNPHLGFFLFLGPALLLAVDAVLAVQVTRRARLSASAAPTDLVVGDRFSLVVAVAGPRLLLSLALPGAPRAETLAAEPPATGTLTGRAASRGVVHGMTVEVASRGLCGLVGCVRVHEVHLARPLEIGPRPVMPALPLPEVGGGWGDGVVLPAADGDLVRGVRDYLPGDRLRQVHWRATARHGELVVKESEEPQAPVLHLVLDMGVGGAEGEAAAGRAAWYGCEALRRGFLLVLATCEAGRTVAADVPTALTVNRRLARAGPGRPERPARRRDARVLVVTDEGDSWR